ncbi:MAG: glycosyltransferase [Cytophagales bacterium]|nr:MAG: glycosyltransferase [Cytophagales bacterium]TAF62125.1 MAG: glycosyltransferase [Cytophagales bacterium]
MQRPRITIVTPSLNQAQYIEQTIDSVLSQNYPNLEYIVIDGGSKDESVQVIKKYEKHLTYWESQKDRGQSHAINKGIFRATGQLFNWLNSDDWLAPYALATVAEAFANPEVTLYSGNIQYFEQEQQKLHPPEGARMDEDLAKFIAYGAQVQPCTFYKLSFVQRVGGLNEQLHFCMDKELYLKYLLLNGTKGIYTNQEVIAYFRQHQEAKSANHIPFLEETALIYWGLANFLSLGKKAKILAKLVEDKSSLKNYQFSVPGLSDQIKSEDYDSIFAHFIYALAEGWYYTKHYYKARKVFMKIDTKHLPPETARLARIYKRDSLLGMLGFLNK